MVQDTKTRPDLVINNELLYNAVKDQPNQKLTDHSMVRMIKQLEGSLTKKLLNLHLNETTTIDRTITATRTLEYQKD